MTSLNPNPTSDFLTFSFRHFQAGLSFFLNSQWRWDKKRQLTAQTWEYHLVADVDGKVLKNQDVWITDDLVVIETKRRPKIEKDFYFERRGDYFVDSGEAFEQPDTRARGTLNTDKFGYHVVNEGYLPVPDKVKISTIKADIIDLESEG